MLVASQSVCRMWLHVFICTITAAQLMFRLRDVMHKRGLCRHAVSVCLSVCHVCGSYDHTNKDIFEIFSRPGSHAILVFPYQTGWRYSDGNPPNGGIECRWGRQPYESRSVKNKAATNGGKRRALTAASIVHCSHKTTTKCLWWAWRYTPETKGGQPPGHNPLGHDPVLCCHGTS